MDRSLCECPICRLGHDTRSHKKLNLSEFINETSIEQKNSVDLDESFCLQCHHKVGKGITHVKRLNSKSPGSYTVQRFKDFTESCIFSIEGVGCERGKHNTESCNKQVLF